MIIDVYMKITHKKQKSSAIHDHIISFEDWSIHYSNKKSSRVFFPKVCRLKRCMKSTMKSIQIFQSHTRSVENENKLNIPFGYPRSDTCSSCDKFYSELKIVNAKLSDISSGDKVHSRNVDIFAFSSNFVERRQKIFSDIEFLYRCTQCEITLLLLVLS